MFFIRSNVLCTVTPASVVQYVAQYVTQAKAYEAEYDSSGTQSNGILVVAEEAGEAKVITKTKE